MVEAAPPPPVPVELDESWAHRELHARVLAALYSLPSRFESELVITGVAAVDLHTLGSPLSAGIEFQTIEALNQLRSTWDPDDEYATYRFVRQPQQFPDVVLRSDDPEADPKTIMGIELKGWYALAKETEPTFRFKVTPAVCQSQDLLVVIPWALHNVVSGSPRLLDPPYVVQARYAAEWRNWFWQHSVTGNIPDRTIHVSDVTSAYPAKSEHILDRPATDPGQNFGRLARYEIMDDWTAAIGAELLSGIPVEEWRRFLKKF